MSKSSKSSTTRTVIQSRRFTGITYITQDDFRVLVESKSNLIKNFAWIYHDRDKYSDGRPKEPHIHFIFCMRFSYPLATVKRWFSGWYDEKDMLINTLIEICVDPVGSFEYFDHHTHPEKAQYDKSEIHSNNFDFFLKDVESIPEDKAFMALDLLINGVSYYDLARRFGRDFIYHFNQIRDLADAIKAQESALKYKEFLKQQKEKETTNGTQNFR